MAKAIYMIIAIYNNIAYIYLKAIDNSIELSIKYHIYG